MAHVRVGDYKKQQLTAMQLYKLKPKNPYYFWAVMSIVMQVSIVNIYIVAGILTNHSISESCSQRCNCQED